MNTFIYALIDPRTNEIRYVGKSNMPNIRYKAHIRNRKQNNTHKNNWINLADWIGSNTIATNLRVYKSFNAARLYARKLKIETAKEWRDLYENGKISMEIPKTPYHTYKSEWKGWADFLGKK